MIAFGCAITAPDTYERWAAPGIRLAAEPDSLVIATRSSTSLPQAYNGILRRAAAEPHLEGLALLHQDLEITDPEFAAKVRRRFADDPGLAVVGIAGARGVTDMAWWECDQLLGAFRWEIADHGGGVVDQRTWDNFLPGSDRGCHEVDAVDGILLVLSPWAVSNLRFAEDLGSPAHGYDVDICFQARAAGKRVAVDELRATHHHDLYVLTDPDDWAGAYVRFMRKWEGRLPGVGGGSGTDGTAAIGWEDRARVAEARARAAAVARHELSMILNHSDRRLAETIARCNELERRRRELEGELERMRSSASWRYTKPFRLARALAGRASRARPGRSRRRKG